MADVADIPISVGVGQTDVGCVREGNEDCFFVDSTVGLYIVSDGMGGYAAGEVASRTAVDEVSSICKANAYKRRAYLEGGDDISDLQELARQSVEAACSEIYRAALKNVDYGGMGCTLTMLWELGKYGVMAHVGDSRLYRYRDGDVVQISEDHTVAQELANAGVIPTHDIDSHKLAGVLTRALGTRESVKIDTKLLELRLGDRYLLCSDGFSNYLRDSNYLKRQLAREDLSELVDDLVAFAKNRGGLDNITVVVIEVKEPMFQASALVSGEEE